MLRENRLDQSKRYLEELKKLTGYHFITQLLETDLLLAQNKHSQASSKLQSLIELHPDRYSAVEKQITLLVRKRKLSEAKNLAIQYLRSAEQPNPRAWRELASIQEQLGEQAASHESLAQFFIGLNELPRAQSQLKLALRYVETASQDELRLQASLKNLLDRPY